MAEVTSQESARIISHMNADHPASLTHYLEAFPSSTSESSNKKVVSNRLASTNPKITEFNSDRMTIEYGPDAKRQKWVHQFQPKMYAGQARKRLEAMHTDARKRLGLSEVTLNEVKIPTTTLLPTLFMAVFALAVLVAPSEYLFRYLPWARPIVLKIFNFLGIKTKGAFFGWGLHSSEERIAHGIKALLLGPLWGAHIVEIFTCLLPLFKRFNITSTSVQTIYVILTFFGGFPIWTALKARGERLEHKLKNDAKKDH